MLLGRASQLVPDNGVDPVATLVPGVGQSSTQLNSTQLSGNTTPNTTTQTKAGNGRNDCAEFTHAPTSRAAPSPQTQHKQKPATAATIVRNLPTHPQSRCTVGPNTNTNKKQSGNGRIDYAEFSHGGHQIPASKNVLKTSFSKGELGT